MLRVARLIERFVPRLRKNRPVMLVQEFTRWTDRELYFRQEGKNSLHFAYNFRNYRACGSRRSTGSTRPARSRDGAYPGVNVFQAAERNVDRKAWPRSSPIPC